VAEPATAQPAHEPEAARASEAPRRRSTVREAAPVAVAERPLEPVAIQSAPDEASAEPAQEQPAEPAAAEDDRPRRTGWWSRRVFGKG
jgi:ribonuclease E